MTTNDNPRERHSDTNTSKSPGLQPGRSCVHVWASPNQSDLSARPRESVNRRSALLCACSIHRTVRAEARGSSGLAFLGTCLLALVLVGLGLFALERDALAQGRGELSVPGYSDTTTGGDAPMRFVPVDVFVDSGDVPLAAYQFELEVVAGDARIVGVEGGDHSAFAEPPYYDPAALSQSRIIIAALDTGDALPTGQTRVATLHMAVSGDARPTYELHLTVAVTSDGSDIEAAGWVAEGE